MKRLKYILVGVLIGLILSVGLGYSSKMADLVVCKLLKTGQTTQYGGYPDDGFYQKGVAKSYKVYTTGQFVGTSNIYLRHYTSAAAEISFVNGAPDTILSIVLGLDFTTLFVAGDVIRISNATDAGNNAVWTIAAGGVAAHTLTLTTNNALTNRALDANTIGFEKREQHSNACVVDNNTGLMWSQTASDKMGSASDGNLPWTTVAGGYGIHTYAVAVNVAGLAGYSDWRIPNRKELESLPDDEAPTGAPDSTAFPTLAQYMWTSTTKPSATTFARYMESASGEMSVVLKTSNLVGVMLVRGG